MPQPDFIECTFSPCGMNCTICYKHLGKNPCPGCSLEDDTKPEHCRQCRIKACAIEKSVGYCFDCSLFPCKQIKVLDKSYRARYGISLIANSLIAKEQGIRTLMVQQKEMYTCSACGGIISLHDGDCIRCGAEYPLGRRSVNK